MMLNIIRERVCKLVLLIISFITIPLVTYSAMAQKNYEQEKQAAGYLGKLSEKVIASGMVERLSSHSARDLATRFGDDGGGEIDLKSRVQLWHNVALDTVALDHTPEGDDGAPVNQAGPTRTSRALAMVQIAVFEALNTIERRYENYTDKSYRRRNLRDASPDAAVAKAAFDTLSALYPDHSKRLENIYEEDIESILDEQSDRDVSDGIRLGEFVAEEILDARKRDDSNDDEPSFGQGGVVADGKTTFFGTPVNGGTTNIGEWEPDPNTPEFSGDYNLSLGAFWGGVEPFFLKRGDQFRSSPPPLPGDDAYTVAYNEVASLGGAPDNDDFPSTGTDETHFIGNYWGYDGVPLIGVPPRVYNQICSQVASTVVSDPLDYARALALVNVAMADTAIAAWDSKYYYNYWRPVTGIRRRDGSQDTERSRDWNPVGVSVINTDEAIRPTPPFPAYPSGHAAFGAAVFEIMRTFFGDDTAFTFVSDEFNGEGYDPFFPDIPRPLVPVRFESFTAAQLENGRSRVYNGVHWSFDDTAGQEIGVQVAAYLLNDVKAFQPDD